jgi:hypothetical protein
MAQSRSYPKKRQNEVRFRKSLLRFMVLFSLIFVAGLVGRFFVNRIPLEERLAQYLQAPEGYSLKWHHPEVRLRDGLLPSIALFVPRVEVNHASCATRRWTVQNALVKLQLFSLFAGKPRVGDIRIDFLSGQHSQSCGLDSEKAPVESSAKTTAKAKQALAKALQANPWPKNFAAWDSVKESKPFVRLFVKNFDVQAIDQTVAITGSVELKWTDQLQAWLDLQSISRKGLRFKDWRPSINLSLSETALKADLTASLREGELQARFQVSNNQAFDSLLNFNFRKIPLAAILALNPLAPELQYLWLSCQGQVKSPWVGFRQQPVAMGDCEFDGPYGRIVLQKPKLTLDGIESFELAIQSMELDQVINNKRDLALSGVLSRYGQLDTQVFFKNPKITFNGFLKGTEIIFSNSNRREVQKVKDLPFAGYWNGKDWSVRVKGVTLDPGELSGGLEVSGRVSDEIARGQLTVHKLVLDPKIYRLMLESEIAELILYGRWIMEKDRLQRWQVTLAAPELRSKFYKFQNLKVKGQGQHGEPAHLKMSASSGSVPKDSTLMEWLKPTHLDKQWKSDSLSFSEFSVGLEMLGERALRWRRGYARLKNGWQLSSEGERGPDKKWAAWLQWDQPNGRALRWNFLGPVFAGRWSPQTPWLRAWLADHPDFVSDNSSIDFVKIAPPETIAEKINNVGKKAIKKARDLLKPKESDEGS